MKKAKMKVKKVSRVAAKVVTTKSSRKQCGFCGERGHNARSHQPGGRLYRR
jgi:hypothetical protein